MKKGSKRPFPHFTALLVCLFWALIVGAVYYVMNSRLEAQTRKYKEEVQVLISLQSVFREFEQNPRETEQFLADGTSVVMYKVADADQPEDVWSIIGRKKVNGRIFESARCFGVPR